MNPVSDSFIFLMSCSICLSLSSSSSLDSPPRSGLDHSSPSAPALGREADPQTWALARSTYLSRSEPALPIFWKGLMEPRTLRRLKKLEEAYGAPVAPPVERAPSRKLAVAPATRLGRPQSWRVSHLRHRQVAPRARALPQPARSGRPHHPERR